MSLWEQIPCTSITILLLGLLSLSGGIRILIHKKTILLGRDPSLQKWGKSERVRGKRSQFWGLLYAVSGFLLIILAVLTFIGGV